MKRIWQSLPLMLWVAVASPAQAALHEVVVLTNATVTESGRAAAREQALTMAKGMAVARVARKLNAGKAQGYLKTLDVKTMQPLIRGVSVLDETKLEQVYYAKVKVTVVDTPIREAYGEMAEDDAIDGEKPRRAILVLPVYYDGVEPNVWDPQKNISLPLWRDAAYAVAHGALLIPGGDPKERSIVDRDNVLTVPYSYLKPLLDAYGTDEIAVAVLSEQAGAKGGDPVEVVIRRVREGGQKVERFTVEPEKDAEGKPLPRDALYKTAVRKAAELLTVATESTAYLEAKAKRDAKQQKVQVQFTTLKDWARIDKALRAAPGFVAMDVNTIGINQATLVLYLKDSPEAVRRGLMEGGMIVPVIDDTWRIRSK